MPRIRIIILSAILLESTRQMISSSTWNLADEHTGFFRTLKVQVGTSARTVSVLILVNDEHKKVKTVGKKRSQ